MQSQGDAQALGNPEVSAVLWSAWIADHVLMLEHLVCTAGSCVWECFSGSTCILLWCRWWKLRYLVPSELLVMPKPLLSTQVRERGLGKSHMTLWFCRNSDIEHSVSQGFRQWQVFPIGNLPLHQRQQHWRVNPEKKHYWQKKNPSILMWKKPQKWCRCDCFPCLQGT